MAKLVSNTYGDALFQLALEKDTVDTLADEVAVMIQIFHENEELGKLLGHQKISKEEKIKVVEAVFKGKASDDLMGFMLLVIQKDRYTEMTAIFEYFMELYKEHKKIGVAYVSSAIELTAVQKEAVEKRLLETTDYLSFEMHYQVQKELIGGMVIRIKDRVIDSSIRHKLDEMTRKLMKVQI